MKLEKIDLMITLFIHDCLLEASVNTLRENINAWYAHRIAVLIHPYDEQDAIHERIKTAMEVQIKAKFGEKSVKEYLSEILKKDYAN